MPDTPRAIRVPDDLWQAALEKAEANGDTVSDIVRRALERYIKR
jgi:predicted DNA-binding protein